MKNLSFNEVEEARQRMEKAQSNHSNATRRLTRAEASLAQAKQDVAEADSELKSASSNLEQTIQKAMKAAMKKGGADLSLALASLMSKSLSDDDTSRNSRSADDDTSKISKMEAGKKSDPQNAAE